MIRTLTTKTVDKIDKQVKLCGWVHNRRDHGQIIFVDLRDRKGLVQVVFLPENKPCYELASKLRNEWAIEIIGKVNKRPGKMTNEKLSTGSVEIEAQEIKILNEAETPPFEIADDTPKASEAGEDVRLKYRYLDLRRQKMHRNMRIRHKVIKIIRDYLDRLGFIEIETPILTKSTPEGARDFLVPSRLHPGEFYALPQAPQQLKQLLMVGGMERYFQIARCFRDEDLRGDRQPEFTQLDLEMSFVTREQVMSVIEKLMIKLIEDIVEFDLSLSKKLTAKPFPKIDYDEAIKKYGSDKPDLRDHKEDNNELAFAWIINWPLFEWNEDEKKHDPCHHIFTSPRIEDIALLDKDPLKAKSLQYDLVLNGKEVGGGSIRIHKPEIQEKMFQLVGLKDDEIHKKFGHLLKAFKFGAPPHGGIALGLDRLLMVLLNGQSIRDVIAFPKTGDGRDATMEAPSPVAEEQLEDLHIKVTD